MIFHKNRKIGLGNRPFILDLRHSLQHRTDFSAYRFTPFLLGYRR